MQRHPSTAGYDHAPIRQAMQLGDVKKIHDLYRKFGPTLEFGAEAAHEAAFYGKLDVLTAFLEEGESPDHLRRGLPLLLEAARGFVRSPSFGNENMTYAQKEKRLLSMTKLLLVAGMPIPQRDGEILATLESLDPVPSALPYLEGLNTGEVAMPTLQELKDEGISINLDLVRQNGLRQDYELARRAREESGVDFMTEDLRAHNRAPDKTLISPVVVSGRVIRPGQEPKLP